MLRGGGDAGAQFGIKPVAEFDDQCPVSHWNQVRIGQHGLQLRAAVSTGPRQPLFRRGIRAGFRCAVWLRASAVHRRSSADSF